MTIGAFRDSCAEIDARLQACEDKGETILASGRCSDVSSRGGPQQGGATWTWLRVTDRTLRWARICGRTSESGELALDRVVAARELVLGHRCAIWLDLEGSQLVRRRRWFGQRRSGTEAPVVGFAFSRRDTRCAVALRDALTARGIPLDTREEPSVRQPSSHALIRIDASRL